MSFSHAYSVTICPNCQQDLTEEGSISIECRLGDGGVCHDRGYLDEDGVLEDEWGLITQGFHSSTRCGKCEESLDDYEIL